MKTFTVDLDEMLTVAAAVLDANGVLLAANPGFLRLLPAEFGNPVGARVARFFVQPGFAALAAQSDVDVGDGYRGQLTIGDQAGKTRTLRGHVWRRATEIRLLAEYDIAELEKLYESMLDLSRDSLLREHAAAEANVNLRHREGQLLETSLTDSLTGVGNRRRLEQALATEISRVRRNGGSVCAIMADIDQFKLVNDVYGHGAGDSVLIRFSALLMSTTRPTDIVTRFGGEEFIVLMPQTVIAQALAKAEQFRSALAAELIEPLLKPVTSSFGVAELASGEDAESFLGRIDTALYRAKEAGRNKVIAADPTISPSQLQPQS